MIFLPGYYLLNTVQNYAWGSTDGIPAVTGLRNPENVPLAEMWLGAHPASPSIISVGDTRISLDAFINDYQLECLGPRVRDTYKGALPFLLKILSAGTPLSLQVHPGKSQAEAGYEKENHAGIPLSAYNRNYKDSNHKPEIILALTPFLAMSGFRLFEQSLQLLSLTDIPELSDSIADFAKSRDYIQLCTSMLKTDPEVKRILCARLAHRAANLAAAHPDSAVRTAFSFVLMLAETHPDDTGIFAPLYLNCIQLQPGQGMYLPSGILHAYVRGTGIELMANSDNVLRGGLTPKYIDVPELVSVLSPDTYIPDVLEPDTASAFYTYKTPSAEFALSRINPGHKPLEFGSDGPSILLCTEGEATINGINGSVHMHKGSSLFIPAISNSVTITGTAMIYSASVPDFEN